MPSTQRHVGTVPHASECIELLNGKVLRIPRHLHDIDRNRYRGNIGLLRTSNYHGGRADEGDDDGNPRGSSDNDNPTHLVFSEGLRSDRSRPSSTSLYPPWR